MNYLKCPTSLNELDDNSKFVKNIRTYAKNIKNSGCFLNMVIYGKSHSGKYTLAKCLLNDIYGPKVYDLQQISHTVKQNCSTYTIQIYKSPYHYETCFTGLQFADRIMLISLLDDFFSTYDVSNKKHKILLIRHFNELTIPAQMVLKRKIESSTNVVRYIFLSNSLNCIDYAIKSRLMCLNNPIASSQYITEYIKSICNSNRLEINNEYLERAVSISNSNIKCAYNYYISMLECKSLDFNCPIIIAINDLLNLLYLPVIKIDMVRKYITQLQLSKIELNHIFKYFIRELSKEEDTKISEIVEKSCYYDYVNSLSNKYSLMLETYFISIYNIINNI